MITSLATLADKLQLKVSVAYINVNRESNIFNAECFEAANSLTTKTGGYLIPLCNSTKGQTEWDMWGSFTEWNFACVSLVSALNLILNTGEDNFIILNDSPFLFFARYRELVVDKNLNCWYFPLSTGKNHAFGNEEWRINRIQAEEACFELVNQEMKSKVISLGNRFAERMTEDYGLTFWEKDFLQNGLCFGKYEEFLEKKFNNKHLLNYGIDVGNSGKIIFSWGRCSIAKGFLELAKAWKQSFSELPNHHLIMQIPNNSGETSYFLDIKSTLKDVPRTHLIDDFNPNIWKTILRNENTDVVCIPSLMDPFPHTSIEAKLFCENMNYITIISNVDGAIDAFDTDESLYVNPRNTEFFALRLIEAAKMNAQNRREIIDRNIKSIEKFNFHNIFEKFIVSNMKLNEPPFEKYEASPPHNSN